ncbi:hypothetical protein GCM10020001_033570 [Nonomuraea salmonea]
MLQRDYTTSQLDVLEAEAIHIMREVAAEFERPCLLFSGGKDSIVMLRIAEKAFWPAPIPFPLMHVDTGHNFDEVIEFRDRRSAELGARLIVASVQDSIDQGRVVEDTGRRASRNRLQTTTLLDAIEEHEFDAVFGGARRDEEKARAKERVFSFRDDFGQWDPKNQRPELWNLYNSRIRKGEHIRVFPLSNWTELDIWDYIRREGIEIPSIYFSHTRKVFERDGMLLPDSEVVQRGEDEPLFEAVVRYRTVGDMTCTGAVQSTATTVEAIIEEIAATRITERGGHQGRRPLVRGRHGGPQARGLLLMDILRFATAGSVDDGKSTLIGRLLYDSKAIFEDQLEAVERTSRDRGTEYTDLSLLTDGLRAEREQGITIDVAYRYFATPRRKFIIADTPGHIQYTRNMVTGASTADLAIILIDARKGVLEQSRRHAFLTSLLRVPHLVLAVNKMDLVDYSQGRFEEIREEFTAFASKLNVTDLTFIPISALNGDNVVSRSENMPWYLGTSLLHHLENVHIASDRNLTDVRFPVQYVIRPQRATDPAFHDYRGYAGQVAGGVLKPGDEVVHLPSGLTTRIASIDTFDGPVEEAFPPMSVTLRFEDDLDISRGDMIARPNNQPQSAQELEAMVCWMADGVKLTPRSKLTIKHTTRTARALVRDLHYRLDVNTLHRDEEATALALNEIGRVSLRVTQPLFVDDYARNRLTGGFILVDEATNSTVGAGMIIDSAR